MGRRSGAPLTQEQVNRLKPGQVLNDGRVPGLGVRRGEDRLTWRLKVQVAKAGIRYTTKAGDERVRQFKVETLNPVGEMTLAEARERAEIVKGKIKTEIRDPATMRRRANATEITLKQAWDRYIESRKVRRWDKNGVEVQKPLSPKSIRDLEDTLRLYFGDWKDRTLAVLAEERDAFEAHFFDLTNTKGGRTANKAVGHFRAVWREAKGKLPDLPSCPADAVTKLNSESERKSAYQPEELTEAVNAVWKAGRFRAGIHLFMMLTGQRSGAVMLFAKLNEVGRRTDTTFIVIHHSTKADGRNARGSNAIIGNSDGSVAVLKEDEGEIRVEAQAVRYGPDGGELAIQIEQVILGSDPQRDGQTISGPFLTMIEQPEEDALVSPLDDVAAFVATHGKQRGDTFSLPRKMIRDHHLEPRVIRMIFERWEDTFTGRG